MAETKLSELLITLQSTNGMAENRNGYCRGGRFLCLLLVQDRITLHKEHDNLGQIIATYSDSTLVETIMKR